MVEIKVDGVGIENMPSYNDVAAYRIRDGQTIQLITRPDSKLLEKLMAEHTDYIRYPAIQVKGETGISFITDELSIKFKGEVEETYLVDFANK